MLFKLVFNMRDRERERGWRVRERWTVREKDGEREAESERDGE